MSFKEVIVPHDDQAHKKDNTTMVSDVVTPESRRKSFCLLPAYTGA